MSATTAEGKLVTITQATVTIQAVKVNGKAMTIALFDQLPLGKAGRANYIGYGSLSELPYEVVLYDNVEVWGYVWRPHNDYLLFTKSDVLYKAVGERETNRAIAAWKRLFDSLPQLYIAV